MTWQTEEDPAEFEAAAGPLLRADPVRNTVALTALAQAKASVAGSFASAWWEDGGGVVTGAVLQTAPYPLHLVELPDEAVRPLVDLLLTWNGCDKLNGPSALAVAVAILLGRRRSRPARLEGAQRLFRLDGALRHPAGVAGSGRRAGEHDLGLLVGWARDFGFEAGTLEVDPESSTRYKLEHGGYLVWEHDGEPVSLAGYGEVVEQMARIGPVYTPPGHRGRGFGAAVTAAATEAAQQAGAEEVVLFTDLTNPTSNALYPRLGYRHVADRALFAV